jgi:hypothetical protein
MAMRSLNIPRSLFDPSAAVILISKSLSRSISTGQIGNLELFVTQK